MKNLQQLKEEKRELVNQLRIDGSEVAQKVEEANREVKAQMEEYKRKIETLGIYSLSHFGLFGQNAEHFYTYSANK